MGVFVMRNWVIGADRRHEPEDVRITWRFEIDGAHIHYTAGTYSLSRNFEIAGSVPEAGGGIV